SAKPRGILHTVQEYNEAEWQESKWNWSLKEECCEAQIQEKELQEIQAMLKQCAAKRPRPPTAPPTPHQARSSPAQVGGPPRAGRWQP
ncbi:MAG: hypothetical protein PUB55_00840, partial [Bacteroidales bacterium]|nr:hypothetical protein [Bacteroidales bacterium]